MSFAIDLTKPSIRTYGEALNRWSSVDPWRGKTGKHDERPLDKRPKKHMSIRLLNDDSIALRLHGTDVVVYHPDNSITLTPYQSISTDIFANHHTPSSVSCGFNHSLGYIVNLMEDDAKDNFHLFTGPFTIKPNVDRSYILDTERTTTQRPFKRYGIDRRKAKEAAKKYDLAGFTNWFRAVMAMDGQRFKKSNWFWNQQQLSELLLSDRDDKWFEFMKCVWASDAIKKYREIAYCAERVGVIEEIMLIQSFDELQSVKMSHSRNRWYV